MRQGRLRVITGPDVEPVSATEVKLHTRVTGTTEDDLIDIWIKAARELAEAYQSRAYVTQTLELSFDDQWPNVFWLPRCPVQSITSVKYYDTDDTEYTLNTSVTDTDTDSEPARISLGYGQVWPTTTLRYLNAIKVRYVAGYGDDATTTPGAVKAAIMLYCDHAYENRTGETEVPKQFWDLLKSDRVYT